MKVNHKRIKAALIIACLTTFGGAILADWMHWTPSWREIDGYAALARKIEPEMHRDRRFAKVYVQHWTGGILFTGNVDTSADYDALLDFADRSAKGTNVSGFIKADAEKEFTFLAGAVDRPSEVRHQQR